MSRQESIEEVLKVAAQNGETAKLVSLLERGAPFVVDMDGQTVLHLAAIGGNLETVGALLDRGCDSNIQDFCGHTSLQRAAAGGHLEVVKLLLEHGATVDHQDELYGNTALHEAAWKGYSNTVNLLCKRRSNVYIRNRGGFSALHLSCQNGHNQSCRNILFTGCKPDLKNDYGDTPIHTAARYGHAGVIRILVSANCKVSEQNKNGDTALHIASAMGRRKLTRILLEIGVNRELRNKQGETALDIGMRKNLTEVISIFQAVPVKPPPNPLDHQSTATSENPENPAASLETPRVSAVETQRVPLEPEVRRVRGGGLRNDHNRVNFKKSEDTESSDVTATNDVLKSLNKDIRRRQHRTKSSQHEGKSARQAHHAAEGRSAARSQHAAAARSACDCGPILEKIGKRLETDKKQIMNQINDRSRKLDGRLETLELKTKKQINNFNQTMKECFAEERSDCQSRMDRLSLKERVELERQQAIRDILLKRDVARWLQAKMLQIEQGLGTEPQNKAIMRKLTRKKSRRETRTLLSDLKNGTLRRSNSAELISEVGDSDLDAPFESSHRRLREGDGGLTAAAPAEAGPRSHQVQMYRGLRISDRPSDALNNNIIANNNNKNIAKLQQQQQQQQQQQRRRVRHNSDGNYDDINLMQETIFSAAGGRTIRDAKDVQKDAYQPKDAFQGHDSIYENLMPLYSTDTRRLSTPKAAASDAPPPVYPRKAAARQLNFNETKIRPPLSSDTSSIDSHNDSGYSTRIAVSEGPSPPLIDGEPLLDPQALYMIPPDMVRGDSGFMKETNSVLSNNNSGFMKASDSGFINYEDSPECDGGVDLRMNQAVINPKSSFV